MTALTAAKADYEAQTFDAFDDDPTPELRRSAAEYLEQLAGIRFTDREGIAWTFWALAPVEKGWAGWARAEAADRDRGWLDVVEHVWLARAHQLHRALVDVRARAVLQVRP